MTVSRAVAALEATPRIRLASVPTPLMSAPHLAASLGRAPGQLWLKLDQYTGFAFGGNKVRKLETELAPPRLEGVDTLITAGGPQSNHVRVTAAAAAHLGLRSILVINGDPPVPPLGNARLHRLLTPGLVSVAGPDLRRPTMERIRAELTAEGRKGLIVPLGASTGRGALGYAMAMLEFERQVRELALLPAEIWIVLATSSGGTMAGLLLGLSLLGRDDVHLLGISADDPAPRIRETVLGLAEDAAALIGYEGALRHAALEITDAFVGEGYGVPTPDSDHATERFARTQGVFLDPTYTAKAAAGLVEWLQSGRIPPDARVVFWHTGGQIMAAFPATD